MRDLQSLLERVKAAGEYRDRELDADIAEALGFKIEWKQQNYTMDMYPVITWPPGREPCPEFSRSIDAAVALVERVLPGMDGAIAWSRDMRTCEFARPHPLDNIVAEAKTLPLAILAALLTALIAKQERTAA
jgi:hypothetical protein